MGTARRWLSLAGALGAVVGCGSRTPMESGSAACPPGQAACHGSCGDVLSDDDNCGGCGIKCSAPPPSTATCTSGRCLVTLVPDTDVADFAVSDQGVFWTTYGEGTVMKVPLGGGPPTILASGYANVTPSGIAVDAANVYWTNYDLAGTIMKVPVGGGSTTVLASGPAFPARIAVRGANVFWATWANHGADGSVLKVPVGGGTATTLAHSQTGPDDLIVDADSVYWTTSDTAGKVRQVPIGGGTTATLVAAHGLSGRLAIVADTIFYCTYDDADTIGTLMKVPRAGGTPTVLATGHPADIAADATHVYFTDYASANYTQGTVMKVATDGGAVTVLALGQNAPGRIAVDRTSLYWIDENLYSDRGMSIMKLTPK
jgi:hypothetical protein